jgi:peptide/nickel transport system permease protein
MKRIALRAGYGLLLVLLTGLVASVLIRLAPGYGVDERELGSSASTATIERIRAEHQHDPGAIRAYIHYVSGFARGDWGDSESLNRPVKELVRERLGVTARIVATGLAEALLLSMFVASLVTLWRNRFALAVVELAAGALVCLPAAVLGMVLFLKDGTPSLALALVLIPKLYRFMHDSLAAASTAPHVLAAHSRGMSSIRIFLLHVVCPSAPELIATLAVSIPLALGACVAIEVVFDTPGLGQLAWQAAMARDLILLVNLTLLIAAATIFAGMIGDALTSAIAGNSDAVNGSQPQVLEQRT